MTPDDNNDVNFKMTQIDASEMKIFGRKEITFQVTSL